MGVATDNCCVCGGKAGASSQSQPPTEVVTPAATATATPSLTLVPSPAPMTAGPTRITAPPTSVLDRVADWDTQSYSLAIDYKHLTPGHTKFCGPALVGGYDIAVAMCSPLTECGKSIGMDPYGINGNDCPDGLMCFGDIHCGTPRPTMSPKAQVKPTTTITTASPTIPTAYCGTTYNDAAMSCMPSTSCVSDDDCNKFGGQIGGWAGKTCYSNILCTVIWQDVEDAIVLTATPTAPSPSSSPIANIDINTTRNATSPVVVKDKVDDSTAVVGLENIPSIDTSTASPVQEDDFIMIDMDGIVGDVVVVRTATKSDEEENDNDDNDDKLHEVTIGSPTEHYSNKQDRLLRGHR